jgi:hypothetical protein
MKILKSIILSVLVLTSIQGLKAQNEFSKWYFGDWAGLDFMTSPPTVLTNGSLSTSEGCATISDNMGNLLFYTDGIKVYNSLHAVMANGNNLSSNGSSSQAAIIVKQPGNTNIYYIFTVDAFAYGPGACYSIVDMNLASGQGSVTVKNTVLYTLTCEKQVAVRHCNGKDVWIVSHEYNSSKFMVYLLTSAGLSSAPVISSVGPLQGGSGMNATMGAMGQLKVSPDGKRLGMATFCDTAYTSPGSNGFHLFDFDASSGMVSNALTVSNYKGAFGVEFSPDGSKLYGSSTPLSSPVMALFQWDVCAPNNLAIIASQYSVNLNNDMLGSLQRAIDGKIYQANSGQTALHVINTPNNSGAAMSLSLNALSIAPKICGFGLPNYINSYTRTPAPVFNHNVSCQNVSFSAVPAAFSSGCSLVSSYPVSGYLWDFGDPSSGAANSSMLSNPVHNYSSLGNYTVSLILYGPCANDTLTKVISIIKSGPNPTITVSGPLNICKGETHIYSVSGGGTYIWGNSSMTSNTALSPTITSVYSVTGTAGNGCSATNFFTVAVNECVGLKEQPASILNQTGLKIFPNPFNQDLFVETSSELVLIVLDLDGKTMIESRMQPGINFINTENLQAGIYSILAIGPSGTWRSRLVKIE